MAAIRSFLRQDKLAQRDSRVKNVQEHCFCTLPVNCHAELAEARSFLEPAGCGLAAAQARKRGSVQQEPDDAPDTSGPAGTGRFVHAPEPLWPARRAHAQVPQRCVPLENAVQAGTGAKYHPPKRCAPMERPYPDPSRVSREPDPGPRKNIAWVASESYQPFSAKSLRPIHQPRKLAKPIAGTSDRHTLFVRTRVQPLQRTERLVHAPPFRPRPRDLAPLYTLSSGWYLP